jgi:hypothetical protein
MFNNRHKTPNAELLQFIVQKQRKKNVHYIRCALSFKLVAEFTPRLIIQDNNIIATLQILYNENVIYYNMYI